MSKNQLYRLERIQAKYPGVERLTLEQVSILVGLSVHTIRKQIHARRWPIPFQRSCGATGMLLFDVQDVAAFLDEERTNAVRRRGRPTKAEEASRATMTAEQGK